VNTNDLELLANTPPERLALVKTVESALSCMVGTYRYATYFVTTGPLLWETLLEHKAKSVEELNSKAPGAYHSLIKENIRRGHENAERIAKRTGEMVIDPTRFEPELSTPGQRLTQDEFMFIWYFVLGPRAHAHDLPDRWAQSTGSLLEATRSIEIRHGTYDDPIPATHKMDEQLRAWIARRDLHDRKICDSSGNPLEFHNLLREAVESTTWLHSKGFEHVARRHAKILDSWRTIYLDAVMDPTASRSEYSWHNGKRIDFWDARLSFNQLANAGLGEPVPLEPRLAKDGREWITAVGGAPMLAANYEHAYMRHDRNASR
jgi:hypothetical protein